MQNDLAPAAAVVAVAPVVAAVVAPVEPVAPPAPSPLRVLVGGDLIPHRPSLATAEAIGGALAPLAPLFGEADGVIANYEAATGDLEKKAFRLAYAAPPSWLGALPGVGIRAVSVANNHACDLSYEGVEATLAASAGAGLVTLGGDMKGDPWAPRVVAEGGGKKVCAIAWTTLVNAEGGCARSVRLAVAPESAAGRARFVTALTQARAACDATIAIVHGGAEYKPQTPSVLALARRAADAGADAVVLHHPHVASPVLVHHARDGRDVPIFASVGNLVSNQGESWKPSMFPVLRENRRLVCVNGWTRLGVIADLTFDLSGAAPRLDWGFHLTWTENSHADDRKSVPTIATRLVDPAADAAILEQLAQDDEGPVALFSDPCWRERGGEPAPRCGTSLARSNPDLTARARRTIRRR
ncbi:MAG: CapA family protein [Labilithrix sp.]|nr:CapA family protein [Labilithrix sp.]MCW5817673.1 CapA family protein [Labilithrix sp.]